eukprot:scaffold94086_cov33-Tisochrysis_lutea.AAC.2
MAASVHVSSGDVAHLGHFVSDTSMHRDNECVVVLLVMARCHAVYASPETLPIPRTCYVATVMSERLSLACSQED